MKILLIEDEKRLSETVTALLEKRGLVVDSALDGELGYQMAMTNNHDLIILDIMLPKMDGYKVLTSLRQNKNNTPIIMLTSMNRIPDKVKMLNNGADDYLEKPFSIDELYARILAISKRYTKLPENKYYFVGDVEYNLSTNIISNNNGLNSLTSLESKLFQLLLLHKTTPISKDYIINQLWGNDSKATVNNVDVYVSFLRKKLKKISSIVTIKTIRNKGYCLEVSTNV